MTNKRCKWNIEKDKFLIENYGRNGSKLCSQHLKTSRKAINSRAKRLGLKYYGSISEEEGQFIKEKFPIFGVNYCREKLNKTTSEIESYVLRNRIKSNKNYQCDIKEYIDINKPEIIYLLGFLWADGCITKNSKNSYAISTTVTRKDSKYIKRVVEKWPIGKWGIYQVKASERIHKGVLIKAKPSTNFYYADKFISNFLVNNDYRIKSGASADKILSIIPENLKHYWWRGYFDGDGSFYHGEKNTVQFSSVHDQDWNFMIKICKELDLFYSIYQNRNQIGRSSTFNIARKNDCIKFLDFIYQNRYNDKIGYDRKFKKYKDANLQLIEKSSKYVGVCIDKSKTINPWVCYYQRKYIGCAETQEKALELRENYIKNYGRI